MQNKKNNYTHIKQGYYDIGGVVMYFRAAWEAVYATYLAKLVQMRAIKSWDFEPETFWFEGIRRGVCSYKPDFRIKHNDDSIEYIEVKGYMDSKSQTKIKRMAKYYPKIKLTVVNRKGIADIRGRFRIIVKKVGKPNG
jgi:hypothetical protein